MKLEVLNIKGQPTGREVTLDANVFGVEPNEHVVYLAVKQYLANQRQGTHKTKTRSEISGSTRKIKKQKGTGTARAGSIKSPVFRGGGTMFGPEPRDYSFKLNKKVKRLAGKSVLSSKAKDKLIKVLEDVSMDAPKTKAFIEILSNLSLSTKKSIFVVGDKNDNLYLSSRNIPNTRVITASEVNTYDLLHADEIVLCESSIEKIQTRLN
jgi:large subunit ribosomal protein L4